MNVVTKVTIYYYNNCVCGVLSGVWREGEKEAGRGLSDSETHSFSLI